MAPPSQIPARMVNSDRQKCPPLVLLCHNFALRVARWQHRQRGRVLAMARHSDPDRCDRGRDMTFRSDGGIRGVDNRREGDALGRVWGGVQIGPHPVCGVTHRASAANRRFEGGPGRRRSAPPSNRRFYARFQWFVLSERGIPVGRRSAAQRRMTPNNAMSITPYTPADPSRGRFEHGSILSGNPRPTRVSSQWNSTVRGLTFRRWSPQRSSRASARRSAPGATR